MRASFEMFFVCVLGGSLALFVSYVLKFSFNLKFLDKSKSALQGWFEENAMSEVMEKDLKLEALSQVLFYEKKIKENFLEEGMLVNRSLLGFQLDQCDSLLFSSLRYTALEKLGLKSLAEEAWLAIAKSYELEGKWIRHPQCREALSKDMFLGLMTALVQRLGKDKILISKTRDQIEEAKGYFDDGPIYLSYLPPPLRILFDNILVLNGLEETRYSDINFSLSEFEILTVKKGYRSHLTALYMWLTHQVMSLFEEKPSFVYESPFGLSKFLGSLGFRDILSKKRSWLALELYSSDIQNLFFKIVFLNEMNLLKPSKFLLLRELLERKEFPKGRDAWDCDRKADYLWQRYSEEYVGKASCQKSFHGLDFIWILALLWEA